MIFDGKIWLLFEMMQQSKPKDDQLWQVKTMIEQLITKMQDQVLTLFRSDEVYERSKGFALGHSFVSSIVAKVLRNHERIFLQTMFSHGFCSSLGLSIVSYVTFHRFGSQDPSIHGIHDIQANEEATKKGWCDAEVASNKAIREEKTDAVDSLKSDIEELTSVIAKLGKEVGEFGG